MATTLKLVEWLAAGVTTTAGVPVASGVVRFYQPSTLTPQTVYSDSAGSSAISPPLVLSAGGNATVYTLDPVRMIIKDALDVTTLWDVTLNVLRSDQVYVTSPAFNGGTETTLETILNNVSTSLGGSAGYWKGLIGTSERNIKDMISDIAINVKDYGAVGDNSTNDTAAIQAAATAASGKRLLFPAGTYRIASEITLPASIIIEGAGDSVSTVVQTSGSGNGFVSTNTCEFRNIRVNALTTSTGTAISGANVVLRRVNSLLTFRTVVASTAQTVISDCVLEGANDASSKVVTSSGVVLVANSRINPRNAAAIGIEFTGGSNGLVLAASMVGTPTGALTGTGIKVSSTTGPVIVAGGHIAGAPAVHITSAVLGPVNFSCPLIGNVTDERTGAPVTRSFGTSIAFAPDNSATDFVKVIATAAITVTVSPPTYTATFGRLLVLSFSNASGGAVTWTFDSIYKVSAAVNPSTGNRITVTFYYDPVDAKWSEVSRSATVPN